MRTAIRKSDRFEVLKRDKFTCAYCGRKPPSVTLQVDHIIAVKNGGSNDVTNLVTSCAECNIGKGVRPLQALPAALTNDFNIKTAEEHREREQQVIAYHAYLREEHQRKIDSIKRVRGYWESKDSDGEVPHDYEDQTIRKFLELMPEESILRAIDIALSKDNPSLQFYRFRYFCGVCWRALKNDGDEFGLSKATALRVNSEAMCT